MAIALAQTADYQGLSLGNKSANVHDVTLDTYAKGGFTITPAQAGLAAIGGVLHLGGNAAAAKYRYHWDKTAGKLIVANGGASLDVFSVADIKGGAAALGAAENADQAAATVNSGLVSTAATFTVIGGGKSLTIGASPDAPRNVLVVITNDSGGALNLYEGVTTYTVTGTFRGVAQVDTITFTSTAGNKSVANTKFRYKAGVKPFDKITTVTFDNAGDGGLKVSVGLGSLFGLPKDLATPVEGDVKKVIVTAADYDFTGKVSTANNTVDIGTTADAADVAIEYMASGEVLAGVSLAAAIPRLMFVGY